MTNKRFKKLLMGMGCDKRATEWIQHDVCNRHNKTYKEFYINFKEWAKEKNATRFKMVIRKKEEN